MTKEELGKKIFEVSYLTGDFTLRSGTKSTEYFDKYRFLGNPNLLGLILSSMVNTIPLIYNNWWDFFAYLEMGAIPLCGLSELRGIKSLFIRKSRKSHGTERIIEGDYENLVGQKVCIIEDIITTGGAVIAAAKELRKEGVIVRDVYCVIDREADNKLADNELNLHSLFTMSELKELGNNGSV